MRHAFSSSFLHLLHSFIVSSPVFVPPLIICFCSTLKTHLLIVGKMSNNDLNDWASNYLMNNLSSSNDNNDDNNEDNSNRVDVSNENTPSDSVQNMDEDDGDDPRLNLPWLPVINK